MAIQGAGGKPVHQPTKPPAHHPSGGSAHHGAPPPSHTGGSGGSGGSPPRPSGHLSGNASQILRAIAYARHQIGTPYVWGGSAPGGFDCSGLVYAAYRAAGYNGIGRTTYDQIKQGIAVSQGGLRPGDIIFPSAHHEGLYVGNGMVLEAPHTGDHVKLIPLSSFGFWQARRLIGGGGGIHPPAYVAGQSRSGLPIPHAPGLPAFDPRQLMLMNQQLLGQQMKTAMAGAQSNAQAWLKNLKPPALQTLIPQAEKTLGSDLSPVQNLIQGQVQQLGQFRQNALQAAGITRSAL